MESPRPDALIETIRVAPDGSIALWPQHAERLARSARELGFAPVPADIERHAREAAQTATANDGDTTWRLRLLYARNGAITIETTPLPPLAAQPAVVWAETHLATPAAGVLDSAQVLLRHKTTYRPWYATAADWLTRHPEVFDLLYVNEVGEVCEGSRTNIYARLGGQWLTPPTTVGCLPGTVRAALLARQSVRCAILKRQDIAHADALRLSNGLRGWFDVKLED